MMDVWLGLVILTIAGSVITQDTSPSIQSQQKLRKLREEVNNLNTRRSAIKAIPRSGSSNRPVVFEIPLPQKTRRTNIDPSATKSKEPVTQKEISTEQTTLAISTSTVRVDVVETKQEPLEEPPTPEQAEKKQEDSLQHQTEEQIVKSNRNEEANREDSVRSPTESKSEPDVSQKTTPPELIITSTVLPDGNSELKHNSAVITDKTLVLSRSEDIVPAPLPNSNSPIPKSVEYVPTARTELPMSKNTASVKSNAKLIPQLQRRSEKSKPNPSLPEKSSAPSKTTLLLSPSKASKQIQAKSTSDGSIIPDSEPAKSIGQGALAAIVDSAILAHESNDELSRSLIALKANPDNPQSLKSKNIALMSALKSAHLARRSNDLLIHAVNKNSAENHIHPADYNYAAERRILEQAVDELKNAQTHNEELSNAVDRTISMARSDYDGMRYNFPLTKAVNSARMAQMSNFRRLGTAISAVDLNQYSTTPKPGHANIDFEFSDSLSQESRKEFGAAIQAAKQLKFGTKARMGY